MAPTASGSPRRQAIREFLLSQARYWTTGNDAGRYNAVYPNGDGKRDIPDFTEVVPDWIWRYYLETGDTRMLEQTYDKLAATAGYIRRAHRHLRPDPGPGHPALGRQRPVPATASSTGPRTAASATT